MAALRRTIRQVPERASWLVLCEGRTEKEYFARFKPRVRSLQLHLEECQGSPKAMVRKAIRRWRENRSRPDFDLVWCVVDVDDHAHELVEKARRLAGACPGVRLAISNPCIELWALLHFQEQTAWISREAAQELFEKHSPGYLPKKRLPIERLFELETQALAHARKLTPGKNPSTGIPDLIEALLAKGRSRD